MREKEREGEQEEEEKEEEVKEESQTHREALQTCCYRGYESKKGTKQLQI